MSIRALAVAALLATATDAAADVPALTDAVFPGEIALSVDATDTARGIFRIHETIPVSAPGPVTLLYPKWIPGNHAPSGPIDKLAGLTITANGQPVRWRRDPVDVFAFHVDAPAGAASLDVRFQFVSATQTAQGRVVMTPVMLNLQWITLALYPAGYTTDHIRVAARATLPEGWRYGTALDTESVEGATAIFAPTDFATLADSPMFAGKYFRQIDLMPGAPVAFRLNMVADRPDQLAATDAQVALHRSLVRQLYRLYGPGRFNHYDGLLALSESLGGIGLEHLRSSENNRGANYFTDWDTTVSGRDLLAHEFNHSWNGKYRRPADLTTANFDVPMRTSLLWVYEGQTQYYGYVLAARSGLWSRKDALESLALTAATYDNRVGRAWRPMGDTVNDPTMASRRPEPWRSWQRSEDYYSEGQLIWLDADTLIRERTHGARSLDDFARAFFASDAPALTTRPYTLEDVVSTLNGVTPYDWAKFLRDRIDAVGGKAPLDGFTRGGYRLVYTETRSDYQKSEEKRRKTADFFYSLGFTVGEGDKLGEVLWDSVAFNAGLTVGTQINAVNGVKYDADGLRRVVTEAKTGGPLELLVMNGDRYRTVSLSYTGGQRYPHLERIPGTPDRLGDILRARS